MADLYTCPWCRAIAEPAGMACANCGAPIDISKATTESGWIELPPIKDMAKIQFGQSSCQIEGMYVPVADMTLADGEGVYFSHHVLLWMEPQIRIGTMPMSGGWKRMRAGLPLVMMEAFGPGHVAFSEDRPGEVIALPLDPGQAIDVREHHFLVATHSVHYDYFQTNIWLRTSDGDDTETHYPLGQYMDRFSAPSEPGLLLVHAGGNTFLRMLAENETILIKATSLLFKDPTVQAWLHFEEPANAGGRGYRWYANKYVWLAVRGPGRVAIQSAYASLGDLGNRLVKTSPSTSNRW